MKNLVMPLNGMMMQFWQREFNMKRFVFKMECGGIFDCIARNFEVACIRFEQNQMGFKPQDILEVREY